MKRLTWIILSLLFSPHITAQTAIELAGKPVESYPGFLKTRSFNWDDPVYVGIDPTAYLTEGLLADVYIVEHQNTEEWASNPELVDARGDFQTHNFQGITLGDNHVLLESTDALESFNGSKPGKGYDIVLDVDQDGLLSESDFIDGMDLEGLFLVGDMSEPGPFTVDTLEYSESFWHTFRVYYPSNIEDLDAQPLVVISHGWTHEYWYYDFIGYHLASYGYVVMSHRNDVGNGGALATTTASTTALENIDVFLESYTDFAGGMLAGKIRHDNIVHTGHSTGGECVVRSYKRLFDGDYEADNFTHDDIVLVNSLAPVAFLDENDVHPENCNYHQFLAAADTDVSGSADDGYVQPLSIYERGYGNKQVTYIHGVGHEDLHGNPGDSWASGPDLIGREATHTVMKPYLLALCELYTKNNIAMRDYFSRSKREFRPSNIDEEIVISGEYRDAVSAGNFVLDNFQSDPELDQSSSGGNVEYSFEYYDEILMKDIDGSFEWTGEQWSNGMTRARFDDDPHCAVMAWDEEDGYLEFDVVDNFSDWRGYDFLTFRACQLTRHPLTSNHVSFAVEIEDVNGETSTILIDNYGGIGAPYPRNGGGYLSVCLEEGVYTVNCFGSNWEEEMTFDIPGYFSGEAGQYELVIGPGDPCTEIEVFMYDSWGDGWDAGVLNIVDSEGETVAEGTLLSGSTPDIGFGWQNEFYNFRIRLRDFLVDDSGVDISQIASLTFLMGDEFGSSQGAIGLDDIQLNGEGLTFNGIHAVEVIHNPLNFYPNPLTDHSVLAFEDMPKGLWSYHVFDSQGRIVQEEGNLSTRKVRITRDNLPAGIYTVVTRGAEVQTLKFVVL